MLWFDNWLPMGPILSNFEDIIIYDSGLSRHARVSSIIQNEAWAWPVANSPDLLILKESIPPSLLPSCEQRDRLLWKTTLSGSFSTSAAWRVLRSPRPKVEWHRLVWFSDNIPKAAFILWLAIRKRLGTQDRLINPTPTGCLFYSSLMKTHEHRFFECAFTEQVWRLILAKCYNPPPTLTWSELISWMVRNWKGTRLANTLNKLAIASIPFGETETLVSIQIVTTVWSIWYQLPHISCGKELQATP